MDRTRTSMNWDLCALCQVDNIDEKLVCPVNNTKRSQITDNLPKFRGRKEGRGVKETLRTHQASWHKSCFNKCSSAKLCRAQKRKNAESSGDPDEESSTHPASPVKSRRASLGTAARPVTRDDTNRCFFCEETGRVIRLSTLSLL